MIKSIEHNEFDDLEEFNNTNGNHHSAQTATYADEDISLEEEQQLAGYNPTTSQLISAEYRLKQDEEGAIERPLSEKPSVRLGSVVALVGAIIGGGALLWFGFLQPKPAVRQVVQTATPSPKSEPFLNESAELKSRLAFQDQQQQLGVESVPTTSSNTTPQPKPSPVPSPQPRTTTQTISPRTTPVRIAQPTPTIVRYTSPTPTYTSPLPRRQTESNVDPLQRWNQLASLGQSQVNTPEVPNREIEFAVSSPTDSKPAINPSIPISQKSDIQTVLIGSKNINSQTNNLTPGMMGILNRTPVGLLDLAPGMLKEVAIGTSAKARVIMPMIWDEGGNNPSDRFAVELTKDLKATDGTVALPAGTIVIAKTTAVGKKNNLVSASAIALVYPDSQGKAKQETIVADTLLVRGRDKKPLIAKKLNDVGSDIAQQDLLIGLLSSLGKVGSIVNQPNSQSSTVISSGTFNQTTITNNPNRQIWAAALEGFFNPVAERLSRRSDQAVQDLMQRPNIQFLAEDTEVSVVVNNFLKVSR